MRTRRFLTSLAALVGIAVGLVAAGTALADGPPEAAGTVLEGLPPAGEVSGEHSGTLSARLYTSEGEAVGGVPVTFYVLNTVFGERMMKVGEVLTDSTGTASLVYVPTWVGDHTVVVRYGGDGEYLPAQSSFRFSAVGPVHVHEDAEFGLEPVRRWLPPVIGVVVLAVWGVLGLVVVRTMLSMQGEVSTVQPAPMVAAQPKPPQRVGIGRPVLLVAAVVLVATPVAWLLTRESGEEARLSTESAQLAEGGGVEKEEWPGESALTAIETAIPATLLRSIPTTATDPEGRITADSADLPADVAVLDDRVFVLDTNNGRILKVTRDGKLAPVLETARSGDTSLWGATAMTAHDGKLYVANTLAGNVVVIEPSGRIESVIRPHVTEESEPLKLAGIAVSDQGDIYISDSDNHRVLKMNEGGKVQEIIGEGIPTSGDYGFNSPGSLALDGQGNLLVVDTVNYMVKKFSPMGDFLAAIGGERLADPKAVAVDGVGNIFVSDRSLLAVQVFGPDGAYLGSIGREDPADEWRLSWLQAPHGLKVDGDLVYVTDRLAGLFVFQLNDAGGSATSDFP